MRKKLLSFLLCSSMLASNTSLVFANSYTTEGEQQVGIEGEVISTFEVILPTSVALEAGKASVDIDVTVTKNTCIGDGEILSVVPEEVIYLSKDEGVEFVEALIHQKKTNFYGVELGTEDVTTKCTIETGKLNSGSYDGVLKFNISLSEEQAIIVGGESRTWNWLVFNDYFTISDDGVLSRGTADLSTLTGTLNLNNEIKVIDTKAFEGSSIDTIVLGESVEKLNDAAFMSADSLTSIEVVSTNPNFTSVDGVLFNSDGTKLLAYPAGNPASDYKIASNVTEIGDYAFAYCTNIVSLTIPSTITKTGRNAFADMCVVSSKFKHSSDYSYSCNDQLNTDIGSILMAKKVNGYLTNMHLLITKSIPDTRRIGSSYTYSEIPQHKSIITLGDYHISQYDKANDDPIYFCFPLDIEYLVYLNGISDTNGAYIDIAMHQNNLSKPYNFVSYYTSNTSGSYYPSSIGRLHVYNILFSEIDIYDDDNNLIYKADIVK